MTFCVTPICSDGCGFLRIKFNYDNFLLCFSGFRPQKCGAKISLTTYSRIPFRRFLFEMIRVKQRVEFASAMLDRKLAAFSENLDREYAVELALWCLGD